MDTQKNNSEIFSDYSFEQSQTHAVSKNFMANVFMMMFGGLALSALFAYLFSTNDFLLQYLIDFTQGKLTTLGWATMLLPIGFVMLISFGYSRLPVPLLIGLFLLYSVINGISFSFILLIYTSSSIIGCFVSSAAMFGIMAVMGYTTNKDLTSFGKILSMGLIGLVIAILLNIFMKSGPLDYIISIAGVAIFTGLTAYDVQKLKRISMGVEYDGMAAASVKKLAVLGALNLYLDFVNIFLFVLRLFGSRR